MSPEPSGFWTTRRLRLSERESGGKSLRATFDRAVLLGEVNVTLPPTKRLMIR